MISKPNNVERTFLKKEGNNILFHLCFKSEYLTVSWTHYGNSWSTPMIVNKEQVSYVANYNVMFSTAMQVWESEDLILMLEKGIK